MSRQKPSEEEVIALLHSRMDEAQAELVKDMTTLLESGLGNNIDLHPVRRKWWKFWKPKYSYPELESKMELKVKPGMSLPIESNGQVVKVRSSPEYDPDRKVKGGQMVRTMPRQLRKIKNAQETKAE